jgi:hypothetical protein
MGDFWDVYDCIGQAERDERNRIQVARVEKNGKHYVDVRAFYRARGGDEWLPGKGVAIPEAAVSRVFELLGAAIQRE